MAKSKEKVKKEVKEKAESAAPPIVHVRDLPEDSRVSISGGVRSKDMRVKCGDELVGDITRAVMVLRPGGEIEATCEYHPPDSKNPALREEKKVIVEALDVSAIVREVNIEGWERPEEKVHEGEMYAADLPENARVQIVSPANPALGKITYGVMLVSDISSLRITMGGGGLAVRTKAFFLCKFQGEAKEATAVIAQGTEKSTEIQPRELAPGEQLESVDVPVGTLTEEEQAALREAGGALAELKDEAKEVGA
ncbi:MAG: hypothetical protein V3W14_07330 [Candidatus Neomarinimicrobiota bacterium]